MRRRNVFYGTRVAPLAQKSWLQPKSTALCRAIDEYCFWRMAKPVTFICFSSKGRAAPLNVVPDFSLARHHEQASDAVRACSNLHSITGIGR